MNRRFFPELILFLWCVNLLIRMRFTCGFWRNEDTFVISSRMLAASYSILGHEANITKAHCAYSNGPDFTHSLWASLIAFDSTLLTFYE